MTRLTWLADVLRGAGLTVHEVPGWQTRGAPGYDLDAMDPVGVICHATAGSRTATDQAEVNVLLNGSSSAPPPIAQTYVGRNGHWWVVAAGVCNHAGSGGLWGVSGNRRVIGVEAGDDNRGEPWPVVQLDAYQRGVAAMLRHLGLTASRAGAHREWNPAGKTDPVGIDMAAFRVRVAQLIASGGDDMFTDDDRAKLVNIQGRVAEVYPIKQAVLTILEAVGRIDEMDDEIKARLDATRAELLAEVDQVEELLAALEAGDPEQLAQRLAALLGDKVTDELLAALTRIRIGVADPETPSTP